MRTIDSELNKYLSRMHYNKSQIGWTMVILFGILLGILCIVRLLFWDGLNLPNTIFQGMLLGIVIISLMFYRLRIQIDHLGLRVTFGIGLINFRIRPEKITTLQSITTPWWYGWGIRFTPKGRLYNIHGKKAVYMEYKSFGVDKKVMLGTEEPEVLIEALKTRFDCSLK